MICVSLFGVTCCLFLGRCMTFKYFQENKSDKSDYSIHEPYKCVGRSDKDSHTDVSP